jgi:diguanylate cyclase
VADTTDWKKKHHDTLREMAAEEGRWRELEQILRRLVARLCAVAVGEDTRLNVQLDKLAAAARRDADAIELKALFDSLTDTFMASELGASRAAVPASGPEAAAVVDAVAPPSAAPAPEAAVPAPLPASSSLPQVVTLPAGETGLVPAAIMPAQHWELTRDATAILLERLREGSGGASQVHAIRKDLVAARDDAALAAVIRRLADLASEQSAAIARERGEVAAMLSQVTERLSEMAAYLASANEERQRDHHDGETLNNRVLEEMSSITDEVRASVDLSALRTLVAGRLEAVAVNVRDFHERELQRFELHAVRAQRMHSRIAELERESNELHRSLELEKRRSRVDSLTEVANRVSFDERFAAELARWKRFHNPVAILLWDIDHFKAINDACGHRAGDAVLREVANCLSRCRREIDFFARIGGEEFVSLLVGSTVAQALRSAEQMRAAVESLKFHFRRTPVRVTVSCGLTELRPGDTVETVFDRADAALYQAKGAGRNVCVAV